MTRRYVPLHETVEITLAGAINAPGLSHIKTHVEMCEAEGKTSAKIDFRIAGRPMGVSLLVCADSSFVLIEEKHGGRTTRAWTAEEAEPDPVTAAVIAALMMRVTAITGAV